MSYVGHSAAILICVESVWLAWLNFFLYSRLISSLWSVLLGFYCWKVLLAVLELLKACVYSEPLNPSGNQMSLS